MAQGIAVVYDISRRGTFEDVRDYHVEEIFIRWVPPGSTRKKVEKVPVEAT
jgi:hypothetical protein